MSRIGKKTISVPAGVEVKVSGRKVTVKGPKGLLEKEIHASIGVKVEKNEVKVMPLDAADLQAGRFHGLTRTIVNNMIIGVTKGFSKSLTLVGVGYRAQPAGKAVTFSLGYSHPIEYTPPQGIEIKVDKQTSILVAGCDKEVVGQVASVIRGFRPPEPYHGKGVRYAEEVIATKVGKAAGKK